jgi:hypothetical protein
MTSRGDDTEAGAGLEAEFDVLTGRLGIEVPPDLKGGVLRGYRGLRAMTALLRDLDVGPAIRTDEGKEPSGG